jgi:hypothetical protein
MQKESAMNAINVQSMREELRKDIRKLELEEARIQERRAEKERMLELLTKVEDIGETEGAIPVLHHPMAVSKRRTIAALGPHYYKIGNTTLKTPGEVLEHFNVPHYYSKKNPGRGDTAHRQILRWANQDPVRARTVLVVLANGSTMDLNSAVRKI